MNDLCSLRSMDWPGQPIVHACTAQADWGQLLLLTQDGGLQGLNLDSGRSQLLAQLDLPERTAPTPYQRNSGFKVHCALSGDYAVVADDGGTFGLLVNLRTGQPLKQLHGGDYHTDIVPFSIAFTQHQGRDVLIHRKDWNRLDAMDCATGKNLTERPTEHDRLADEQSRYLDYFHGRLLPNPSHTWLLDDGWCWGAVGIPMVWSLPAWLGGNPWESEDGPTHRRVAQGVEWDLPCVWLDDEHIAIWNVGNWDDYGFGDCVPAAGVTLFDIHAAAPEDGHAGELWPMPGLPWARQLHAIDGKLLVVAADRTTTTMEATAADGAGSGQPGQGAALAEQPAAQGSWLWDVASRQLLAHWPQFAPQLLHPERRQWLQWTAQSIRFADI